MNKLCLSACLGLATSVHAQTAPNVVFVGDAFTYNWQQSAAFKANTNWIGQGLPSTTFFGESNGVAAAFQTALNQHPATVFIETGTSDISWQTDSNPLGSEWEVAADDIIQMVQMAQMANVKVILGNVIAGGFNGDFFNGWLQTYAQAQGIPIVNFEYWLANGCQSVMPPPCILLATPSNGDPGSVPIPNDMGYEFITQMAQSAIATYGLKIKSGYLSDMWTESKITGSPVSQVNSVPTGAGVQFTAQAVWSDGVTRPMLNIPYNGAFNIASMGTWWSTNSKVMTINQQGHAAAYTSGTVQIWFRSANGVTFSPCTMTVTPWYTELGVKEPVY